MKKLITHDGPFHTDDIFAAATISLVLEKAGEVYGIVRTRDEATIQSGDFVFDVGGVCDADTNKFDHHQKGGAGKRLVEDVEIEYASFGLVWKKFGEELTGSTKLAEIIDEKLVAPIDANDNGFTLIEKKYEVSPFLIQDFFSLMRPTWKESEETHNTNFIKAVEIAKEILTRSITHGQARIEADHLIKEAYKNAKDKRIIVLDGYYPSGDAFDDLPEPLFIVYPRESQDAWVVKAVRDKEEEFKNRKDLPTPWAGLSDDALQNITGVSDAMFCHRALFLAVAQSKEGAIKLAELAVVS